MSSLVCDCFSSLKYKYVDFRFFALQELMPNQPTLQFMDASFVLEWSEFVVYGNHDKKWEGPFLIDFKKPLHLFGFC